MADRSVRIRLTADVRDASSGLEKVADKSGKASREVSALERRLAQLAAKSAEPKVNLDSDEARRRLTDVQARLTKLGASVAEARARVDDGDSLAKLSRIEAQLLKVGTATARPDIDLAGVAAAESDLAGLTSQLNRFDGRDYRAQVHIDGTLGASRRVSTLTASVAALGPAVVASAAAASGALLGLSSAAGVAAAGAGASSLAFIGVGDALKAMSDAETAAASNAADMARKQVTASRQVADARRGVAEAERGVTEARRRANELVASAEADLADAGRRLAEAQFEQHEAQIALTEAREDAVQALRDLREESSDLALSEEGAEIRLIEARRSLNALNRDSAASALDLRKARLDVAEAEDRLSDVRRDQRQTTDELQKAERAGLVRTPQYLSALDSLAQANGAVTEAQREHREAQQGVAEAQREGARIIAEAQRGVVEAHRGVRRALADMNQTMSKSSSEADKLRETMAQLSPAGRRFVRFLHNEMRPRLEELQGIAQRGMFPGVEAGLRDLLELFPIFEDLVRNSSNAMGGLAEDAGEALTSPFWRNFFRWVAEDAGPTLDKFGRIAGNTAEGFAGLAMASDEMGDSVTNDLLRMSRRFSQWGRTLESNQEFQEFVKYVNRVSPKAWRTLTAVADALLALAQAAAPVGEVTLPIIKALAQAFAAVMRSPAGPIIVGAAVALATLNRAIRLYDITRHSRFVGLLGGTASQGRHARRRLGGLATFLRGPWGLALGAAAVGLGIFWTQQQEAKAHVDALRESLNEQTGAITRNTKAIVVKKLEESGALETARKYGISLDVVARAALGNRAAQRQLNRELNTHQQEAVGAQRTSSKLNLELGNLRKTVLGESGAVAESRREHDRMKTALDAVTGASNRTEIQALQHEKQLGKVADQLGVTRERAQQLINKYGNIPKTVHTDFEAHTRQAIRRIGGLRKYTNKQLRAMEDRTLNILFTGQAKAGGGEIHGRGTGTSDSNLIAASKGEWVIRERAASAQGPAKMAALNAGHADVVPRRAQGGPVGETTPRFANGGRVGDDVDLYFRARRKGFENAFDKLARSLSRGMVGPGAARAAGTYGVGRWADEAATALRMLGQPISLVPYVLRLIAKESGGNPSAINLWDINAIRGTPSIGLIQTIGPTFHAYNHPRLPASPYHPLANLYAGLNYALHRYGSLTDPDIYVGGYRHGSWNVPRTGLADLHQGEMVIPRELAQVVRSVSRPVTSAPQPPRGGDGAELRVTGGRVEIGRNSFGQLEGYVRDLVVQEIGDEAAFQKRRA